MPRYTHWFIAAITGLAALETASFAKAQEDLERSRTEIPTEIKKLRDEVDAMRRDLRQVQATLKRIEEQIGKSPSEFSPVTIRVQSEDARPLPGFTVEMESARKEVRRVSASGRSDHEGLALSRQLPYGDYHLRIKHESGWSTTSRNVTVEVGKALEKIVIAPDPRERASLKVQSALRPDVFEGLRFGERREPLSGRGYGVPYSPEPGETDERFASFPIVGDGIRHVGVELRIGIERAIEQPNGEVQQWSWSGWQNHLPRLLATDDSVAAISELESKSARPEDAWLYFAPAEGHSGDYIVGFLKLKLQEPDEQDFSLEIAPGNVTLLVAEILGKADPEVLSSLHLEKYSDVWLECSLSADSEWVPRVLDLDGWERETSIAWLAKKTLPAGPGEQVQVTVASPHPSSRRAESE